MEESTWPAGSDRMSVHRPFSTSLDSRRRDKVDDSSPVTGNVGYPRHEVHKVEHHSRETVEHHIDMTSRASQSQVTHENQPRRERERHLNITSSNNIRALDPLAGGRSSQDFPHKFIEVQLVNIQQMLWNAGSEKRLKARSSSTTFSSVEKISSSSTATPQDSRADFSLLPFDVLQQIAGSFSWPELWAATCACKSWKQALAPLREGMLFLHWGKKFKHGHGVAQNVNKALDSFLKGAVRGCAASMVDAGLLLWEQGRREEGIKWYRQATELRSPAGMCNLGLAYLQEPSDPTEAVKLFEGAAMAGHVRAQYNLALCLQQGRGVKCNLRRAARWYLRAAEGGSPRAMYNSALCYRTGEGIMRNYREAKRWMGRAAMAGHHKAQFEHGLTLFAEGDSRLALVFLELATRAGETGATHIRDALLVQLPVKLRVQAIAYADKLQAANNRRHKNNTAPIKLL